MTNDPRPWQQPTAPYPQPPARKNGNTVAVVAFGAIALSLLICVGVVISQVVTGVPDPEQTTAAPRNFAAVPTTEPEPVETVPTVAAPATTRALALPTLTPSSTPAPTRTTTRPTVRPKPTTQKPKPRATTTRPKPRKTTKAPTSVYYKNCTAVRNAGADPIRRGDPGYGRHLDRDGDGVGCE